MSFSVSSYLTTAFLRNTVINKCRGIPGKRTSVETTDD
jgi:hypothetical protein